ncbi:MAG: VOC family protein [Pseudomonadota bacterium]
MTEATLEHLNVTVSDPHATAQWLSDLFDWKIRWSGDAKGDGFSIHVGGAHSYVALYRAEGDQTRAPVGADGTSYRASGGLNHIAVTVDDLDGTEGRVRELGFQPRAHGDYEPGRRFYFYDWDGIEWEMVSYT